MKVAKNNRFAFRKYAKWIPLLLLVFIAYQMTVIAGKEAPVPEDKSVENALAIQQVTSVAESFAKEYYTFYKGDKSHPLRIAPYVSGRYSDAQSNLKKVTVKQAVMSATSIRSFSITDNIYTVDVQINAVVTDARKNSSRRFFTSSVIVEKTKSGALVVSPPALNQSANVDETKGLVLDLPTSNDAPAEVRIVLKNFMDKLFASKEQSDLSNFVTDGFNPTPFRGTISLKAMDSPVVYVVGTQADGNIDIAVATANVTIMDKATGQLSKSTYAYRLKKEAGKYYIVWMAGQQSKGE